MASHHIASLVLATFIVFLRHCSADLGLISWGALTADNATAAGSTLYGGHGTFYGELSCSATDIEAVATAALLSMTEVGGLPTSGSSFIPANVSSSFQNAASSGGTAMA